MVRQFADEQILPNAEHYDHEDEFPEPIVEQMKELGLFGVTIPEEYGGHGPRPHDLRDDRRGALARLDLDLRRHQHALHRQLPADEVRHRRAEAEVPAADGDRRDPRRVLALRARAGLRRAGDQDVRQEGRRRALRDQRPEDVGHQRPALGPRLRARQDRPRGRPAPQGLHLLHHREGGGRAREHRRVRRPDRAAADQEARLQGRRVDRARLRRLQVPGREHPRRRGGGPQQGLRADDGRARGRPRERRRARRRHRPARARAGAASTARSAGRSASRSPSTRRSSSSSPTWRRRSRPRAC